jgi:SAM-dependent methyltransferase
MESISKKHTACRVCGTDNLIPYLDLGMIPLANNLCQSKEDAIRSERFELKVAFCENCGLSQLTEVVDPEVLFSYYTYRSSVNQGYIDHCREMAKELKRKYELNENSYHIDIAGNDGTLLLEFEKVLNHHGLNIDPAVNLCQIATSRGVQSIAEFWDMDVANFTRNTADLITATNVFAHLDNVTEFLEACKIALKDDGVIVIENPYWPITMAGNQFDQVYFEHVSYWSVNPMDQLCEKVGLTLNEVKFIDIHGGSLRYYISKNKSQVLAVSLMWENEFHSKEIDFKDWAKSIESIRDSITQGIKSLKGSIVGFAASAKGNTLLNYCGIDHTILDFICDETPEKIGKFSPGTGIEIKGLEAIIEAQPDYILILSWNFQTEIINKLRPLCPNSKYIIPIPEFQIIE